MSDDDLLRRFAALKASSLPSSSRAGPSNYARHIASAERAAEKEQADLERIADGRPVDPDSAWGSVKKAKGDEDDTERELARRQAALRGGSGVGWADGDVDLGDGDDDDGVEAFIASLSVASPHNEQTQHVPQKTKRQTDDDLSASHLSREAAALLRQSRAIVGPDGATDMSMRSEVEDEEDEGEGDEETEQEILERALAEAELEAANPHPPASTARYEPINDSDNEVDFAFPSLPTHQPAPDTDTDAVDPSADARMALLLGLSGPTTRPGGPSLPAVPSSKPVTGKQPGQGWNLPGWQDGRDDDLDSWCCICNKDATVQCAGCDDDVYCDECWRDGHGPGGEQGHRARRFNWGKKAKAAQGA